MMTCPTCSSSPTRLEPATEGLAPFYPFFPLHRTQSRNQKKPKNPKRSAQMMSIKIKTNQAPWEARVLRRLKEELWGTATSTEKVIKQAARLKKTFERGK
ncbi:MAG: hypothetical protein ACFFCS_05190 [Candidatus Hodarchaeota archaeon]